MENNNNTNSTGFHDINRMSHFPDQNNDIIAVEENQNVDASKIKFKGRQSIWPGAIAIIILLIGGIFGVTLYGIKLRKDTDAKIKNPSGSSVNPSNGSRGTKIIDGSPDESVVDINIENPTTYKDQNCQLPTYSAKNNLLVATFSGGTEYAVPIKGINWFGMETSDGVPSGLWNGAKDGSTMYQIASFLKRNNFNSVRLPLSVENIVRNIQPNIEGKVNTYSNKALGSITRYDQMISQIVKGLGLQSLTVLLDFHYLSPTEPGDLWYGTSIREADTLKAISSLGTLLCNSEHWNVIGIDIKDSPNTGTWGDGSETDWKIAATKFGNAILSACPQWAVFVQGVVAKRSIKIGNSDYTFRDWAGSGLESATTLPITLNKNNKLIYSPKYFTSSTLPLRFFYGGGTAAGSLIQNYVELDDTSLRDAVLASMDMMFGTIPSKLGTTLILSSFGGLYGSIDKHPKNTSTRILNTVISTFNNVTKKIAGGYFYALNPDTSFAYNPADVSDNWELGLVDKTWRNANMDLLYALRIMDKLPGLRTIPCVKK